MSGYIYLASPYSSPIPLVVEQRVLKTMRFVAEQMKKGEHIFSPILHCHTMCQHHKLGTTAEYWLSYNTQMQRFARTTWVLLLPGWEESVGVQGEIAFAQQLGHQIEYYDRLYFTQPA